MAYDGYLSFGRTEIINEERTRAYVQHQLPQMAVRPNPRVSRTLHVALGDAPYESPLVDDAEWVSPSDPATHGFFGLLPLDIQGIGDSTESASVTESVDRGGTVGPARAGTRSIRVHGLLLGENQLAVEAGLSWLKAALGASDCGTHGGGCGSSDLRYFLDNPDVCFEKFEQVTGRPAGGENYSVGSLSPETSPIIVNINQPVDAPSYVDWQFDPVDGVVVAWGRMAKKSSRILWESSPTVVQRTNFVTNPSFTNGTQGWAVVGGLGSIQRVATDGADGAAFARVSTNTPSDVRINWAPDPSLSLATPQLSGWRALFGSTLTGAGGVATVEIAPGEDELGAEVSLLGPHGGPIQSAFSVWLSERVEQATFTILDNLGGVVYTTDIPAGPAGRVDFTAPSAPNYILRLTSAEGQLQFAEPLVEAGTTVGDPFSGISTDPSGDHVYTYLTMGIPTTPSVAYSTPGGVVPNSRISTQMPDTRYGDVVASFALRSNQAALVQADLVSRDDGTVLATREIQLGFDWRRYSLSSPYGRNVKLVLRGHGGNYDLDQVLVEASATEWDYFDGSSVAAEDYNIHWLGVAGASPSRMSWLGSTLVQHTDSNWRPFIRSQSGTLPEVTVDIGHYDQISIESQLDPYERNYHDVAPIQGPKVISRPALDIGAAIEIDFILTAQTPSSFSNGREVDVAGLSTALYSDPVLPPDTDDELVDPDCEPIPSAPRPPEIPELCVEEISDWRRYYLDIPAEDVALWASTVPTLSLITKAEEVRQVRVRFHPNPFGYAKEVVDSLHYCGEFILSYLPANTVLSVNGMNERAFAAVAGKPFIPADHLLYGTGGSPMQWPELSCGMSYVMTIDVPPEGDLDNLDLELVVNRRE